MKNQPLHPHTQLINKKQKNQSKSKRLDALTWLAERFPKIFVNETSISPLKIGIIEDLLAFSDEAKKAGISKSKLREALVVYTRRIEYLVCLKACEMRIDLDSNPTTRVTKEEAERAALKIKRRVEKGSKNTRPLASKKEEMPTFSAQYADKAPETPSPSVTIKRKAARSFDPNAVARLKEKLGIPKTAEAKETVQ